MKTPVDPSREPIIIRLSDMEPVADDDATRFYVCSRCGQAVDKHDLKAVLHHELRDHRPLPLDG